MAQARQGSAISKVRPSLRALPPRRRLRLGVTTRGSAAGAGSGIRVATMRGPVVMNGSAVEGGGARGVAMGGATWACEQFGGQVDVRLKCG